jgi:uncharacterized membrane protein YedE/YeeE
MSEFTPLSALFGGALIGLGALLLLWVNGRIAGVSNLIGGVLFPAAGDGAWRALFLGALVAVGALASWLFPGAIGASRPSLVLIGVAGLLVGFGTRLGSGCTSGHGVCGVARLSPRSLAATAVFVATGIATATALRLLGVGA